MSWLQDLAGKAENILTKIDRNAATVLQIQNRQSSENGDVELIEPLLEVSTNAGPKFEYRNTTVLQVPIKSNSTKSLSLAVKSPKKLKRPDPASQNDRIVITDADVEEGLPKSSDKQYSSRRCSIDSKTDEIEGTPMHITENNCVSNSDHSISEEIAAAQLLLEEIKTERDEMKIEVNSGECRNAESRLKELESLYQHLVDENNELRIKCLSVEESNAKYMKSIPELESIISKHIQNEHVLNQKLEMSQLETKNATVELQQYRVRAHATLQLKENIIEQLKQKLSTNADGHDSNENSNSEQIMLIELEQMKNERINMEEELSALKDRYEQSKMLWEDMESKFKKSASALETRNDELLVQLNVKVTKLLQLEDDLNIKQRELMSTREELAKQKTAFALKLHERETEVAKLRNRIKDSSTSSSSDLELRLNSLTQSLVQKQSSMESVTAERNALRLQLEKLDAQYRSTVTQIRQQRASYLSCNETDDAKSQLPNFMVENPFDNNVARRVKRAYSSLDSVGIRLGTFMRRYPLIRILVIVYVAILHLWVMFVLLSSTPAV
ncbi:golgin-84 [Toxorhynchites rutilus septentrionalis]|uniref:golgin-84 n=1 Tax=Toxorhynchites rutilus septentrionalis TaxID=329112 RepID=UPI00247AB547|nr:golgin-84 [Toxorhynchites rutilus septentrionalis]